MLTAAIVLTGGGSTRMGRHKPALHVGGRPIIVRILEATRACRTVVVGRADAVPEGIRVVHEDPPGSGPVAGIGAGLVALDRGQDGVPEPAFVAVLAGDLPFLTAAGLEKLRAAVDPGLVGGRTVDPRLDPRQHPDVALVADPDGSLNWLCAVWRADALRSRLAAIGDLTGVSMRRLTSDVRRVQVLDEAGWSIDVDTPAELAEVRRRRA